ncbi:unnamed protein product [Eruca vesicaria subsp. sativa]|uniref:Uncharacterized protein n=1 Tax=Eruca vesicaria subsp. sativa TaxID=29727 RepID=A0ABC8KSQ4_ERUVS|nr:unnamed protein product [Eruca vesicaria subsp. sativa]
MNHTTIYKGIRLVTSQADKQFVEARLGDSLSSAPSCSWSSTAPQELEGAPKETLSANAVSAFISIVIMPQHVEGEKLDRTALDQAKPLEKTIPMNNKSFKRLVSF